MARSANPKTVIIYTERGGREPFTEWLNRLADGVSRRRILARLRRLEQGNYGDVKHLQAGVYELRLFFGPGYRVYFGEDGERFVVLLCAGDKSSQRKDIKTALAYWQEYRSHD